MKYTIALSLLILLSFMYFIVVEDSNQEFLKENSVSSENISRPWTFITSTFLHLNITHLILNLTALILFGIALESAIKKEILVIFFAGAIIADIFYIILFPENYAVGASAGIYALIGASILLKPFISTDQNNYFPIIMIAGGYIIYNLIEYIFYPTPNISYISHIIGGIFGLSYAIFVKKKTLKSIWI